jgi:hypothetical protein
MMTGARLWQEGLWGLEIGSPTKGLFQLYDDSVEVRRPCAATAAKATGCDAGG